MEQESWLSGALPSISPILMPAAHALLQASIDVKRATADLTEFEIWTQPNGAPSVGFHLLHIAGSCDRLLTYARGGELSHEQFAALARESEKDESANAALLTQKAVDAVEIAITEIRSAPEEILFEKRAVGRLKLPTNVFGLLFHIAEHTQRHVGQIITTAKFVRSEK